MAGKVGRPKKDQNSKTEDVVREVLATQYFTTSGGQKVFVSLSIPFVEKVNEKLGFFFEIKVERTGTTEVDQFVVPCLGIDALLNSLVNGETGTYRQKCEFLAEFDSTPEAQFVSLSSFNGRGKTRWSEIFSLTLPRSLTAKQSEHRCPAIWLENVLNEVRDLWDDAKAIPGTAPVDSTNTSLDEINAVVAAAA